MARLSAALKLVQVRVDGICEELYVRSERSTVTQKRKEKDM